jgi:S1-C subfamily serine protease
VIRLLGASILTVSLVACSGASDAATPSAASAPTTDSAPLPTDAVDTTAAAGPLSARDVLASVQPSVAFVETDWGAGTAFAIDDGYLLTNAHVVTPFGQVDVTPAGGTVIEGVPVVGVDHDSDLALIGPLEMALPPVPHASAVPAQSGDPVYLIGFPSETEDSPVPTIAEGIVSRLRELPDWDQQYIQTDADIAGGQSGGVLVDAAGQVIGISGASLDEAFALALSIESALERVPLLLSGGKDWNPLPESGVKAAEVTVPNSYSTLAIVVESREEDTDVTINLAGPGAIDGIAIEVLSDDGSGFLSRNALGQTAEQFGIPADELESQLPAGTLLDPSVDGTYTFPLARDMGATLKLTRLGVADEMSVSLTSNIEMIIIPDLDDGAAISVGDIVSATIEPLELQDRYEIDLTAGQSIDIEAVSAVGDMAFLVLRSGDPLSNDTFFEDDSDTGIGGLDALGTFTATQDGRYQIIVVDNFGESGYRLSISPA